MFRNRHRIPRRLGTVLALVGILAGVSGCGTTGALPENFSHPVATATPGSISELVGRIKTGQASQADLVALRAQGPAGLDSLLAAYDASTPAEQAKMRGAIDQVAKQKDADVSRLY